jgi:hypothetical protein
MKWIFDEKDCALNRDHVNRFTWTLDGVSGKFIVQAHITGPQSPFVIYRVDSEREAKEAIKNLVVGREHHSWPPAEWPLDAEHR